MRILFVTHNVPRFEGDAAGSFVLRLAVALQATGARVEIIAPGGAGVGAAATIERVPIRRIPYASEDRMTLAYSGSMAEQVTASWSGKVALVGLLRALRRAVREQIDDAAAAGDPYAVVHAHWWFPAALALWRTRRTGDPPLVITMHGSDVRLATKVGASHGIMRAVLAQASVCTAVSGWLADTASRIAPASAIAVSPMPVDVRHFGVPKPEPDGTPAIRSGVLFVGRLNAQKGIADLLDAMATPAMHAVAEGGEPTRAILDVVGDGPDRDSLMTRAQALGIAHRVRWYGALPQPALVPLYQGASLVAMPSQEEGLGLVAVEAQLCGTPVVAYADGGLLDVVRPDHGGTLVTVGHTEALATAMVRLLTDEPLARRLGALAREDMLLRFSPASVADRYLAHYREATA
ncbi:MAG: glycosyltransferase family 4 protein [Gemmatimonadota bacterium]|nr:glycosyltransferase family 4 protein [Gemmatimonadota bacterium]